MSFGGHKHTRQWFQYERKITQTLPSSLSSPSHCGRTSILVSSEHPIFNCLVFVFTFPQFIVVSRRLRVGSLLASDAISIIPLAFRLLRTSLMTWSSSLSDTSLPSSNTSMNALLAVIEFLLSDSLDCCRCWCSFRIVERRCLNDLLWSFKCQLLSESSSFLKLNDVCALKLLFVILLPTSPTLLPSLPSNDDKSCEWWWLLWSFELWFRLWRENEELLLLLLLYGGLIRPRSV